MRANHSEQFKIFQEKATAAKAAIEEAIATDDKKSRKRQLTMEDCDDRVKIWDSNDVRSQRITRYIGEMLCLDFQPFSIVEDVGFIRLMKAIEPRYKLPSRKYMAETIIPSINNGIQKMVEKEIALVEWFSFTTDIWSSNTSGDSLLSFTAHWLTKSFERKSAVLHAQPVNESHTGENLCHRFEEMLKKWNINNSSIHLMIRDNAANMVKAMKDGNYQSIGCFTHTLQLIVHDGVLSQRVVIDTVATCRRIVGHFKRSPLAYTHLKEIQEKLKIPVHRLKQDEPTRWNSTLYMLQVIVEQKVAIAAYATEYGGIPQLTPNQLDIASKVVAVLGSVEEITKSISTEEASVSLIIPFVQALRLTLKKNTDDDRGVLTMKDEMLQSLDKRYEDIEEYEELVIASTLDPRFKNKFFKCSNPVKLLTEKLQTIPNEDSSKEQPAESTQSSESASKRSKTRLWSCFDEILEMQGATASDELSEATEIDKYLSEPLIPFHRANSLTWWKDNQVRFPSLAKLALRYLSAPPTSVASERLFSGAGEIYSDRRSSLLPEKAEMLLFIKNNFSLVGGKYDYKLN